MTDQTPAVSDALLALIRCPRTGEPLVRVPDDELKELNSHIGIGNVRTADGDRVQGPWTGALVARQNAIYYRVTTGALALAPDEGATVVRAASSG